MLKKLFVVGSFAVAMAFSAGTAKADSVTLTQGGYTATVSVYSNYATITFGGTLTSTNLYSEDVAIHVANGATVTSGSSTAGAWSFSNGLNSNHCNAPGGNWFCAGTTAPLTLFNGLTLRWNFTGGSLISPVSAQFDVCSNDATCEPSDGFITIFSQSGTPVSTPEPGTLYLLGIGLVGLVAVRWHAPSA